MYAQLDALAIADFHDQWLARQGPDGAARQPAPWDAIGANHRANRLLWGEQARAGHGADQRLIERNRQQRLKAIGAIDDAILSLLEAVEYADNARLSSETAGAMIDRLSLLSIKIFHLRARRRGAGAGAPHADTCLARLQSLVTQRHDLARCLDRLLTEAYHGQSYFKVYPQCKLCGDPGP